MGRSDTEIQKDMIDAVMEHESNRDDELEFIGEHGDDGYDWSDEDDKEHERIISAIRESRDRLQNLIREATDDREFTL